MPPFVLTEKLLSSAFKKVFEAFYRRWFVVLQQCSNFSLHYTTEYEISNRGFSDFLRTCYCDLLNSVHACIQGAAKKRTTTKTPISIKNRSVNMHVIFAHCKERICAYRDNM